MNQYKQVVKSSDSQALRHSAVARVPRWCVVIGPPGTTLTRATARCCRRWSGRSPNRPCIAQDMPAVCAAWGATPHSCVASGSPSAKEAPMHRVGQNEVFRARDGGDGTAVDVLTRNSTAASTSRNRARAPGGCGAVELHTVEPAGGKVSESPKCLCYLLHRCYQEGK